jgi:transglutaminase-like putative cysteine protease
MLIGILLTLQQGKCFAASQTSYTIPRHITYSFTLHNTTNRVIDQAELWTYAPVRQTATQQLVKLDASNPFEELSDEAGNTMLHFTFQNLPPYATKIVTINADLLLSEVPLPTDVPHTSHLRTYLRPEPYCESDDPGIIRLATRLTGVDPLSTANNIFQWVAENIEYTGYLKHPRGARYALQYKKGDCTEFMYLFMALCRAAGIPARGLGGYVYAQNAILKPGDYHNWAEFSVDGVWHLADPQRSVLKKNQSHYLVMRVIGLTSTEHPMQHYRRFRYVGEGLKVSMN